GRFEQIGIYLVKFMRLFVYQNDWKVLPMAIVIAGHVSLVVRRDFFVTMEGTLKGALALSCIAIWNGFFNSIQVICREREIIKREHRSGLHISSYIVSHMIYQALLCLVQTVLTIYTCKMMGIKFPKEGLFSKWMMVDVGVTVFLISYSADMISLWISTLVHNTTTAMSIMPFILIAQLVFSGGIFQLPAWSNSISKLMISHYGVRCIAAQADYNNRPMVTAWNTLVKMENNDLEVAFTLDELMVMLNDDENDNVVKLLSTNDIGKKIKDTLKDYDVDKKVIVNAIIQAIKSDPQYEAMKDQKITIFKVKVKDVINAIGRDRVRDYLQYTTAQATQNPNYAFTEDNIARMWLAFLMVIALFATLSVVCLEFIDKDKR
ncbi:MAG: ABC transporter permease, partial [Spirochaetales bacterium]|nr:ABC transporter permease [Spirochaetales bacterium]